MYNIASKRKFIAKGGGQKTRSFYPTSLFHKSGVVTEGVEERCGHPGVALIALALQNTHSEH